MSFASLLIGTCTVQRNTPGVLDDYGYPAFGWGNHLVDEPCRLTSAKGREITVGAEVVIADYKLFIGDVDITEQDRVIMGAVTLEVLLVETFTDGISAHHKQCWLRTVR